MPTPEFCWLYLCHLLHLDPNRYDWRSDKGMTTTEIAVATFLAVGMAIFIFGVIFASARNSAENIPVPTVPGG